MTQTKRVLAVSSLLLLCSTPHLTAQEQLTEHTLKLSEGGTSPPAKVTDFAWLEGRWQAEGFGGMCRRDLEPARRRHHGGTVSTGPGRGSFLLRDFHADAGGCERHPALEALSCRSDWLGGSGRDGRLPTGGLRRQARPPSTDSPTSVGGRTRSRSISRCAPTTKLPERALLPTGGSHWLIEPAATTRPSELVRLVVAWSGLRPSR